MKSDQFDLTTVQIEEEGTVLMSMEIFAGDAVARNVVHVAHAVQQAVSGALDRD